MNAQDEIPETASGSCKAKGGSMGQPMDRSKRVFGTLSSFEKVFPTLENAIVQYTEFDYGTSKGERRHDLRHEGGLLSCGNDRCFRGGYELDRAVDEMLREGVIEKAVQMSCRGDEGLPNYAGADTVHAQ